MHDACELTLRLRCCAQSMFTQADDFTVTFPTTADPLRRGSLVAALLLMNYLMFENKKKNNEHHG